MNNQKIGGKTLKLNDLKSLGLNIPKFTYIEAEEIEKAINQNGKINEEQIRKFIGKITSKLTCKKYAVRSSALIEDSQKESYAGQFKTIVDVDKNSLNSAIKEVLNHAFKFLKGEINKFSLLIQEFIEADYSGITFTRIPYGDRAMIIEYHKGRGEKIVGGELMPEVIDLFWNSSKIKTSKILSCPLEKLEAAIENFKKIETHFDFPQDIEWCIKNKEWYFLQTRPITTITSLKYEEMKYLDNVLPQNKKFMFEKTEISEIAQRPTQITKDLLNLIYKKNGPIHEVYKKHKIKYDPINVIKIIGNELYVDRDKEVKTLLPAYSMLKSEDLTPRIASFSGLFTTIKNIFKFRKISLKNHEKIFEKLKSTIQKNQNKKSITKFIKTFLKDYEIIFEINLLAGISIKNIESLIKKEEIKIADLLSFGHTIINETSNNKKMPKLEFNSESLKGNSLDISDSSPFSRTIELNKNPEDLKKWWNSLSKIKKHIYEKPLEYTIIYNRLREFSRWLVVKNINKLRTLLFEKAEESGLKEKEIIYFAKIKEAENSTLNENELKKRKLKYEKYSIFNLPKILSHVPQTSKKDLSIGVSAGEAKGILLNEKELNSELTLESNKNESIILYTQILNPNLTKYFGKIKGIVSEQGGLLSHLAIVAREKNMPIITNFNIHKNEIKIGDKIKINGSTGQISKLH